MEGAHHLRQNYGFGTAELTVANTVVFIRTCAEERALSIELTRHPFDQLGRAAAAKQSACAPRLTRRDNGHGTSEKLFG